MAWGPRAEKRNTPDLFAQTLVSARVGFGVGLSLFRSWNLPSIMRPTPHREAVGVGVFVTAGQRVVSSSAFARPRLCLRSPGLHMFVTFVNICSGTGHGAVLVFGFSNFLCSNLSMYDVAIPSGGVMIQGNQRREPFSMGGVGRGDDKSLEGSTNM